MHAQNPSTARTTIVPADEAVHVGAATGGRGRRRRRLRDYTRAAVQHNAATSGLVPLQRRVPCAHQTAVRQRAVLQPTADAERAVYPTDVHGARDWPVDPAQKPVQLLACLLGLFANRHELVVDLTCGAGTTAVRPPSPPPLPILNPQPSPPSQPDATLNAQCYALRQPIRFVALLKR